MFTAAEISSRISNAPYLPDNRNLFSSLFSEPAREAAVLVPLTRPDLSSAWHILYTRRTNSVADHKGQVAFPGGRFEQGDNFPVGTALREAEEEIGLSASDVSILGKMESLLTISNYLVSPVVGAIPWNYNFKPQPDEVSRVFTIPINWLAQKDHIEIRRRSVQFPTSHESHELRVIYFKEYDQETVWGISAEITLRLLKKLSLIEEYS